MQVTTIGTDKMLIFEKGQTADYIEETIKHNQLSGLRVFLMFGRDLLDNYDLFQELTFLKNLSWFVGSADVSFEFLYRYKNLEKLQIQTPFTDVDFSKIVQLKSLNIQWNSNHIRNLEAQTNLEKLSIDEYNEPKDLTPLSGLLNLKELSIKSSKVKSLQGIGFLKNLEKLVLGGLKGLNSVEDLATLSALRFLELNSLPKVNDFSVLENLANLEALDIIDCKHLNTLAFTKKLTRLKQLSLLGTTVVGDKDLRPASHVKNVYYSHKKDYTGDLRGRDSGDRETYFSFT